MNDPLGPERDRSFLAYSAIIFLSAFLLFAVQLILGKYFLPWFGGTPATWTTCMCFFQTVLLAGYAYAHGIASLNPRTQAGIHSALLLFSVAALAITAKVWHSPLTPDLSWRPQGNTAPAGHLLVLLSVAVGLPYLVLSSTGPLLQSWFAVTNSGESPYRLYALSNFGSLLALIAYPFAIEPHLTLRTQARVWSLGFVLFVVLCFRRALKLGSSNSGGSDCGKTPALEPWDGGGESRPGPAMHVLWLALALCACVMFLATTNQICQDIAVVPFLWILPLGLYLLSFIVCFDRAKWYSRAVFHPAFAVSLLLICLVMNGWGQKNIRLQIFVYLLTLFVCCMICHGELARSKPAPQYLTSFYLMIALGGSIGGVLVAVVAPAVFKGFWEYPLALWGTALLLFLVLRRDRDSWIYSNHFGLPAVALVTALLPGVTMLPSQGREGLWNFFPVLPLLVAIYVITQWGERKESKARNQAVPIFGVAALVVLGALLTFMLLSKQRGTAWSARNFYGVLSIREFGIQDSDSHAYSLHHGRIAHGYQFRAPDKERIPTGYYSAISGIGRTLLALRSSHGKPEDHAALRIGVVGLGAGTLAAYGETGDYVRFYEINPDVIQVATDRHYFTFLNDCRAQLAVVPGDARISMEHELEQNQSQRFDVLAIDAFSGDAVPVHLLTEEAFEIYLRELKPGGILAVHITNTHLDLTRVLSPIADRYRLNYALLHTAGDDDFSVKSDWVLLSTDKQFLGSLLKPAEVATSQAPESRVSLWTDDYSNLFQVLRK